MTISIVCLWMTLSFFGDQGWEVNDTGIFHFADATKIQLSTNGFVFVMDQSDGTILRFTPDGRRLAKIGGRGQGPGMFQHLSAIQWAENKLYAFDTMASRITVFDEQGQYQDAFKAPFSAFFVLSPAQKIPSGWVLVNWDRTALAVTDEKFSSGKPLVGELDMVLAKPAARPNGRATYRPASDGVHFLVNRARNQVYFYEPGAGFKINIYDVQSGKVSVGFEKDWDPIPFDEDWGRARLDAHNQIRANSPSRAAHPARQDRLKPDFPEFFPAIQFLQLSSFGDLMVYDGSHYLHPEEPPQIFSPEGKTVSLSYPYQWDRTVFARRGAWAFVRYLAKNETGDDELAIKKIPAREFPEWAKVHLK